MNTKSGSVGILLLVIASLLAVGEVFYYFKYQKAPLAKVDNGSQLALATYPDPNLVSDLIVTSTEEPDNSSEVKKDESVKTLVVNDSGTTNYPPEPPKQVTVAPTPPAPPAPPKEPEVTVPTLYIKGGVQPKPTLLLEGAARVPFTVLELTAKGGDIDIYHLHIERQGLGSDRIFTEVGVVDIDWERSLNSNHEYVTNDTFTIANDETREITIFGNVNYSDVLPDYDGQSPTLALVRVETNATAVESTPVIETAHTVNSSLTIGSLLLENSGFDPGTNRNIDIGSNNVTFSAVRATAASAEPVLLQWFAFTQNGSISSQDLANVKICVDQRGTATCVDADDSDGKYYFADFGQSVRIEKGEFADIYIKGDVLSTGVNRTIDFDIASSYDVLAYGLTYQNYFYSYGGELEGVQPEGEFSVTEGPFYNGYAHTVRGGSFNSIGR